MWLIKVRLNLQIVIAICHVSSAHHEQPHVMNTALINTNELAVYEMMHPSTLNYTICGLCGFRARGRAQISIDM